VVIKILFRNMKIKEEFKDDLQDAHGGVGYYYVFY
jgi:hypothetical protein